jgi:ribulose-phosphate 3-epimerase
MNPIIISASILSADFACLKDQLGAVEQAGLDWIHVDVMDGQFVPNITMGPFIVEHCRRLSQLPLDVHLMIENPERHIQAFARAGAAHITVHIENNSNIYRTLQEIRALGCKPGIAINPGTSAASIASVVELVDMVLVMTVNPGFSGQAFIPSMVAKIAEVQGILKTVQSSALIQVDGGITPETLSVTYNAGARVFVAATAIFKNPTGIDAGIKSLRQSVI